VGPPPPNGGFVLVHRGVLFIVFGPGPLVHPPVGLKKKKDSVTTPPFFPKTKHPGGGDSRKKKGKS